MSRWPTFLNRAIPVSLILFQRDNCHLCDQALALLAQVRIPAFTSAFIDGDAELETRYGVRVPVLRDTRSEMELDWPFDPIRLRELSDFHRHTPI